jgi:hypothetical protein
LSLPRGGYREDAIPTAAFEKYIRNNVINWFSWAQKKELDVQRVEDLILVSGCTLVTSWAAAAFVDPAINAEISLESRTLSSGGTNFVWSNIQGPVVHHNSYFDPVRSQAMSSRRELMFLLRRTRMFKNLCLRTNASSSGASEQSAYYSGPYVSELQQNLVLMTLTIAETMRYK